jgi:DNA repair protein RadA/Sms
MASSVSNLAVPEGVIAFGEVGLAGEVRPVVGGQRRIMEAGRMGFRRAIVPVGSGPEKDRAGGTAQDGTSGPAGRRAGSGKGAKVPEGIEVIEVDNVAAAVQAALMD